MMVRGWMVCLLVLLPTLAWAQNLPPVADAGPDQTAYTLEWVLLEGSAIDPEGDPIYSWQWDVVQLPAGGQYRLLDEDTQNLQFLGYVEGDYVLSLTVWDGISLSLGVDYATIHVADNLPPVAVVTADLTTIDLGGTVCFDGTESFDPEGGPLVYLWSFRDGTPGGYGPATICHLFAVTGIFDVAMQVIDEKGGYDFDTVTITVLPPANHPPVASPTATPSTGDVPLLVAFAANASDADGDPLSYAWDFGDGATSALADPAHTYMTSGTFVALLTVSDGKDQASYSLTISVAPQVVFSVASASVKWTKQGTLAKVDLIADFSAPLPAPDGTVMMNFDGVTLFALPLAAFVVDPVTGLYTWSEYNSSISLDFVAGIVSVHRSKVVMTGFDPDNGAEVQLALGGWTGVESIPLTAVNGDRLVYDRDSAVQ